MLCVEIGGFEGDPTKNGRHVKSEAIGQVASGISHGEDIFWGYFGESQDLFIGKTLISALAPHCAGWRTIMRQQQQARQLKQRPKPNTNSWIGNAMLEIAQREKEKEGRLSEREVTYTMTQTISPLTTLM